MNSDGIDFFAPPGEERLAEALRWLSGATVGIAGLGLMGGSLGMALRGLGERSRACHAVLGWSRGEASASEALRLGCVDELCAGLPELCAESDLLVLAAPVRAILAQLPGIAGMLREDSLLIDLGSTKREVVTVMSSLGGGFGAVGGHPMCGKDRGGPSAADAGLYEGKVFVFCPTRHSDSKAQARAWALAEAVGANPLPLDARRHDRLVALISHVPYLAASAVVAAAERCAQGDEMVWQLAASGFRDTTRVAGSELDVMLDILLTNREAISEGLAGLQRSLEQFRSLLAQGDEAGLRERLGATQRRRREVRSEM